MQIQTLCKWLKPVNYKPKSFTVHISYFLLQREVCEGGSSLKQRISIHLDPILKPTRDIKSLGCPYQRLCVCCACGYVERALRKLMFCFNSRCQRSAVSRVNRGSEEPWIQESFTEFNSKRKNNKKKENNKWNEMKCYTAQMQVMHTSPCYKSISLSDSSI